jgi:plastocyanin
MAINFPNTPTNGQTFTSGDTTWEWNGLAWEVVSSPNPASIPTSLLDLNITDGSNGQVLTTDGSGNFSFTTVTSQSGYNDAAVDTHLNTGTASSGQILSWNGSDYAWVADQSGAGGSSSFSGTTDATAASLTVDKIYMQAIVRLVVDNVGTSAYTFASHYSGNNPSIYALGGTTIAFDLDGISGHPFEIQDPTGTPYNLGLVHVTSTGTVSTGSNAQGKTEGTLYWQVPESISGAYRYQCQAHAGMVGAINIKRLSVI